MVNFGLISLPVAVLIFLAFFLSFCADEAISPHEHFSITSLGITIAWGIAAVWGGTSVFTVGAGVGELANLSWLQTNSQRLTLC